ncbi:pectinesterase inhibitor 7 [Cajanus cajan]|uniref:21 kDa protein n=1 Tax=Cajanus cajan TaxID=3821 RepID=A0A151T8K2_CAJCA|nr:pectinesterase inhibitor 7 [Cajanus cajan]KYP63351.1 21 kDa protein [Cajanus cajan]
MTTTPFRFSLLLFTFTYTFTFSRFTPSATAVTAAPDASGDIDFIRASCNTTLYPDLCFSSLSRFAAAVHRSHANLARVAVAVSLSKAHGAAAYLSHQTAAADSESGGGGGALHDCFANLEDAVDEIRGSLKQMRRLGPDSESGSVRFGLSNVLTWMSAALTDEETCTDGFEGVPEGPVKTNVCDRVTRVKKFTSNALALVNGFANNL